VLAGIVAFFASATHGANYIALKTSGEVQARARRIGKPAGRIFAVLVIVSLIATLYVRPEMMDNYKAHVWGFLIPLVIVASLAGMYYFRIKEQDTATFLCSAACIAGMLGGAAFGLYPNVLPSTLGNEYNLTIWNAAAQSYGLRVGVVWCAIGIAPAVVYFTY